MLKVLCVLWRKAADILNVSLLYALLMKSHASGVGSLEFCCRHCFILNFHIMCIYILSIVLSFNLFSTFSAVILTPVSAYWRLEQVWKLLGLDVSAAKLIESLVFSRLDYCNVILAGLPRSTIAPLQWVQNAAARLVAHLGPHDHVTPTPKDHHWLPIKQWIMSQLCLLMHQVHTGRAPSYRHSCVSASASITSHPRLRSTSSRRCERQRTRLKFGERSFSCAGPRAENSLPSSLHELTHTKTFKRQLKTFLFQQAYQ